MEDGLILYWMRIGSRMGILLRFVLCIVLLKTASALPLCLDQEVPFSVNGSLGFCSQYTGTGCCSQADDAEIGAKFQSMNISDDTCAGFIKQVLCAKCDPFAADLFGLFQKSLRSVPVLCNSTSADSAANTSTAGYCSDLWDACKSVSIPGSPFSPSLIGTLPPGSSVSGKSSSQNQTLTEQWQSKSSFCGALGSPAEEAGSFCFDGAKYQFPANQDKDTPPQGVCLDQVAGGGYIGLVPHPDGSNRAFLATQSGKVYLARLPDEGSNKLISVDEKAPFLDISNFVVSDREFGLMSVAFHPDFLKNGRFFVSYNCDKQRWPGCGGGRCACNSEVGCNPSQVQAGGGTLPCQYSSVISEFVAGNSSVPPAEALTANPNEVNRILTLGLPYTTHHGGLLLFGPEDKYLYFMMGDGGGIGDPFNFAQNKKSLLGKILRLDVDKQPTNQELTGLGQWGKYSIPDTNPFVQENGSRPEIWALGLRNPWRCSFDVAKPEYFYCSDVGQVYEEVNLITKGGNYGWRMYDGIGNFTPAWAPGGSTNASSVQSIFPVASYLHDAVNKQQGSASIIGGYVSRSVQDACLYGKYLFADLYGGNMWGTAEVPSGSGNYTTTPLNFTCSKSSPLKCKFVTGSALPGVGFVFAWGEDNSRNVYMLTTSGTFKIVSPSKCDYTCTKKLPPSVSAPVLTPIPSPRPPSVPPSPSGAHGLSSSTTLLLLCASLWLIV